MSYLDSQLNRGKLDDYIVIISGGGAYIGGVIDSETLSIPLGMSPSNSIAASGKEGAIKGVLKGLGKKLFGGVAENIIDESVKRVGSTVKTYGDTNEIGISFDVKVIPGKYGAPGSYNSITSSLARMTQPKFTEEDVMVSYLYDPGIVGELLTNPRALDGLLLHVSIGNWFQADGLFATSVSPSYSTIIDEMGKPLFMTISFSFQPYRQLNADEVAKWLH